MSLLKKDGLLFVALAACIGLALLAGSIQNASGSEESRLNRVLSGIEGAGQVEVAVYYDEAAPCGAVVVAEGADSIAVQLRLTNAVTALLGLSPERIAVFPRQGGYAND